MFRVIEALNVASITIITAASFFPEYIRAKVSAGIMFKMMRQPARIDSLSDQGLKPEIKGEVKLQGVFFAYPNSRRCLVLNDCTLAANSGETLALIGPSGCGKSTTVQLLERFYDVAAGAVQVDGVDIRQLSVRHLRANMALVGQEPTLFNLSVAQNIAYGLDTVDMAEVVKAAQLANIHNFIDSLPRVSAVDINYLVF